MTALLSSNRLSERGAPASARSGGAATAPPNVNAPSELHVSVVTSLAEAQELVPSWASLHARSESTNSFTHPSWQMAWAEHFLHDGDPFIITVRRANVLIGVAPFYWVGLGSRRRIAVRSLHLLGNGHCSQFTEIPGVLADKDEHRTVFSAVITFLQNEAPPWDWAKLTIDSQQGWFEPQWLVKTTKAHSSFSVHHATRACVIVDLAPTWEEFLAARKRNVRESIRRSYNRLEKRVGEWSVDVATGEQEVTAALDRIIELNGARAEMEGKPNHPTMFDRGGAKAFYRDAVLAMTRSGQGEVSVLRCKGETVAGLVTVRAGGQVFTSSTGADPAAWDLGPGTILISELARREIVRGTASINLSCGPNQSKLRWSERLEFNHDFVIVGPTRGSRVRFGLFSQASNFTTVRRTKQWDTRD